MKSVAGSYHQGNALIFGSNSGYQCTANALAALIFSLLFAVSEWRTHNVDQILLYGDSLFSNVIHDRYQENQFFFMASNLPRFANYMGLSLRIRYQFDMMHGVSRNRLDDTEFLSVSIQEGVKSGFIVSNFLLPILDGITVALSYNRTYKTYSVFDLHFRYVIGNPTPEGAAVLLTFDLIED